MISRLYARLGESELWLDFRASLSAQIGAVIMVVFTLGALFAPLISPQDPYDLTAINILDAYQPSWLFGEGDSRFLLGTDAQGRDILVVLSTT